MARTADLLCHDHRVRLWAGQWRWRGGKRRFHSYSEHHRAGQQRSLDWFLEEHRGCHLEFADEEHGFVEYGEVDAERYAEEAQDG